MLAADADVALIKSNSGPLKNGRILCIRKTFFPCNMTPPRSAFFPLTLLLQTALAQRNPPCEGTFAEGTLFGDELDCHVFYSCRSVGGETLAIPHECPEGTGFNDGLQVCLNEDSVADCTGATTTLEPDTTRGYSTVTTPQPRTTIPTTHTTTEEIDHGEFLCNLPGSPEEEFSVADPADCSVYYRCVPVSGSPSGRHLALRFECPGDTGFDAQLGICESKGVVDACQ